MNSDLKTSQIAKGIGCQIKDALVQSFDLKVGINISPWSTDRIEPLKRLPRTSIQLGIISAYQDIPTEAKAMIMQIAGNIVHETERVVVCEIKAGSEIQ